MSWLILNDEIKYSTQWYPTHILGNDKELLNVYVGIPSTIEKNTIGIYVSEEDYKKINHDKAYILIHNPDAKPEDVLDVNWDEIPDNIDGKQHMHIWLKG